MSYEFTVCLNVSDFKRILSWGNKDRKFDKDDKKLAVKIECILEDMIEEEKMLKEDEDND